MGGNHEARRSGFGIGDSRFGQSPCYSCIRNNGDKKNIRFLLFPITNPQSRIPGVLMIQVQALHKSFTTGKTVVKAVDGVSFEARDGEITGLLGPNGAGKTTTLRMLYTLMKPDSGRVLVDGHDTATEADIDTAPVEASCRSFRY